MENFIRHQSLVEQILQGLEDRILRGEIKPGQRLIEDSLCKALGVSRSPLREAFRVLETRGFVRREARKGISVAGITLAEAENIYQIRASLESLAVHLTVKKRDPKVLAELKSIHKKMIRVAEKGNTRAYFNLNLAFHDLLFNASENKPLVQLINNFNKQTLRYRLEATSSPGWMNASLKVHRAIIRSFEAGDAERAERARKKEILSHIQRFSGGRKGGEE